MSTTNKSRQALLKALKKQVRAMQQHEKQLKTKLTHAVRDIRQLSRTCRREVANNVRSMKCKITDKRLSAYLIAASTLEHQILQGVKEKASALRSVVSRIEEQVADELKKSVKKAKRKTTSRSKQG